MGNDNKLVVVALFVTITTKEKKCDGDKLVVVAHFRFKQKGKKRVTTTSLLSLPYSQQQQ
jgi:hypothetical protein